MLSMIDGQCLDERLSTQRDHYPRFNELHKARYGVRSTRSRASFRYHYDAVIKERRGRLQVGSETLGAMREERINERETETWQDGDRMDAWSEETDASHNIIFSQSDSMSDRRHADEDSDVMHSDHGVLIGRETVPGTSVGQLGLRHSAAELTGVVTPGPAGVFQGNMPFTDSVPNVSGSAHAQPTDWYPTQPVSNVPQGSTTACNRAMPNSQLQQVTDTQVLWVPIVLSTTYNVSALPATHPAQCQQERTFTTFPAATPHRALPAPGAGTMAAQPAQPVQPAQDAVGSPYGANYRLHDNPYGFMTPMTHPLCTYPAAATNTMDPMAGSPFNIDSPAMGAKRNWASFHDPSQAMQTQLAESPQGNAWGDMVGWGWPR